MSLTAAAEIVATRGLRELSTRAIAQAIGYSSGTLYQLFADLDDLVAHLNVRTLDGLYAALSDVDLSGEPERTLEQLASRYIAYVRTRPLLWDAVVDHRFADGRQPPPEYTASAARLYGAAGAAIASLVVDEVARQREARVLWAGLYGITALAASNKLGAGETVESMVRMLAETYVAGLRARYFATGKATHGGQTSVGRKGRRRSQTVLR